MPSLKEIRNKISSVKSTKRIMQAMKMIATVKYAKTQVMISSYRPYYDAYKKIISTLSKMSTKNGEKYLKSRDGENDLLIIISSKSAENIGIHMFSGAFSVKTCFSY